MTANLSDNPDGEVSIVVECQRPAGYDHGWLRNAVDEPRDQAGLAAGKENG